MTTNRWLGILEVLAFLGVGILLLLVFEGKDWLSSVAIFIILIAYLVYRVCLHRWHQKLQAIEREAAHVEEGKDKASIQEVLQSGSLDPSWRDFASNLILRPDGSSTRTLSADVYFHPQGARIPEDLRPHWLLPTGQGVLLTLGILGTFFGLFMGLNESLPIFQKMMEDPAVIVAPDTVETEPRPGGAAAPASASGDASQVGNALSALLKGAQLAFSKSIAGLLLSLIFTWRFRNQEDRFSQALARVARHLDECFPLRTAEQDLVELLSLQQQQVSATKSARKEAEEQRDNLADLVERLGNHLLQLQSDEGTQNRLLLQKMLDVLENANQRRSAENLLIVEELRKGSTEITGLMNGLADAITGSMSPKMETMLLPVLQKALDPLVKAQEEMGKGAFNGVKDVIKEGAGQQLEDLRRSLENIVAALENAPKVYTDGLEKAGSTFENRVDSASQKLVGPTDRMQQSVQEMEKALEKAIEISRLLSDAGDSTQKALEGTAAPLREVNKTLDQTATVLKEERSALEKLHSTTTLANENLHQTTRHHQDLQKELLSLLQTLQSSQPPLSQLRDSLLALESALGGLPAALQTQLKAAGQQLQLQTEAAGAQLVLPVRQIQEASMAVLVALQQTQEIARLLAQAGQQVQVALTDTAAPLVAVHGSLQQTAATLKQEQETLATLHTHSARLEQDVKQQGQDQKLLLAELTTLLSTTQQLNPEVATLLQAVVGGHNTVLAALQELQQLIPDLSSSLQSGLSDIGQQQGQASAESVKLLLEAAENFRTAMEGIRANLETATGTLFTEAAERSIRAAERVSGALEAGSQTFEVTMGKVADRMEQTGAMVEKGALLVENSLSDAKYIADSLTVSAAAMAAASREIAKTLDQSGKMLETDLRHASSSLQEGLQHAAVPLQSSAAALHLSALELQKVPLSIDSARKALETEHLALVGWGQQLVIHVDAQNKLLQQQASGLNSQLQAQAAAIGKVLQEQTQGLEKCIQEYHLLHTQLTRILPPLLGQLTTTNDAVRKQYEQSLATINGLLTTFSTGLASYAQKVEASLKLPGQMHKLNDHLEKVAEGLEGMQSCCTGMEKTMVQVQRAITELERRTEAKS